MSLSSQGFVQSLHELLLARQSERSPLMVIRSGGQGVIYRSIAPVGGPMPDAVGAESLVVDDCYWEPIGSVSRLLGPLQSQLDEMIQFDAWTRVLYLFSVGSACGFLGQVAASVGAPLRSPVRLDLLLGGDFRRQAALARRRVTAVRRLVTKTLAAVACSLSLPSEAAQPDGVLRLEPEDGQVYAIWTTTSGTVISREPLTTLVDRVSGPQVRDFLDRSGAWTARLQQCRRTIEQTLREACPQIARDILDDPIGRIGGRVGYWFFSGSAEGFPAEGFLYLDPPQDGFPGRATVLCNRANAEFILQSETGSHFWFPPCMTSCRVQFERGDPAFLPCRPEVRIPRRFPPMIHPYLGDMQLDGFASAEVLNAEGYVPAMLPVSAGLQELGVKLRETIAAPMVRDMCISGQDASIQTILAEARDASGKVQPYALVEGIWRLARQGLMRAHQVNRDTPRARLEVPPMYYPVANPGKLVGTALADRVFRYHP